MSTFLETQTAQPCGKLAVICPLMSFPHPLQNRVPRGERAPVALMCELTEPVGETESFCPCHRFGPEFLGIPGFSRVLRWWDAVWIAAPRGVYFAVFSYLVVSVSNLSVWHIINKSSKFRGLFGGIGLLWLKIEPVCDSLQPGGVFFDVVHLGDL